MVSGNINDVVKKKGFAAGSKVFIVVLVLCVGLLVVAGFAMKLSLDSLGSREDEKRLRKGVEVFVDKILVQAGADRDNFEIEYGPEGLYLRNKNDGMNYNIQALLYRIPEGFPKLIIHPDSVVTGSIVIGEKKMMGLESGTDLDTLLNFYKKSLESKGWTLLPEQASSPGLHSEFFTKNGEQLTLSFTPLGRGDRTAMALSFESKKD